MSFQKFRIRFTQSLNNLLYSSKQRAEFIFRLISAISSVAAILLLIYSYGFEPPARTLITLFRALDLVFVLFVLTFVGRVLYSFRRRQYLRQNWPEALLIGLVVLNGASKWLFGNYLLANLYTVLGYSNYLVFYQGTVSLVLLALLLLEVGKASLTLGRLQLKPATLFTLSFILLILLGAGLLMLPAATVQQGTMPFLDALFTSVSASCVTGLIVVDTGSYFTLKGQAIIMVLMQLGGLGILSFASFFGTLLRQGAGGLKQQLLVQDFLSTENLYTAKTLLRQVVVITLIIELGTFVFVFASWPAEVPFNSVGQKIFYSLFHAVSAFCNAGFSLFQNGLFESYLRGAYILHMVVVSAVIMGGLGFETIRDLFSPRQLRERMKNPWREWRISTKIAVFTSLALLAFGTICIYLLEYNHALKDQNFVEGLITAFFQSGVARTAGFNTVDIGQLQRPTLIVLLFLMFIGANSGSVGGGIKTSTFYLIVVSVVSTIRGQLKIEIGRRFVPKELVFKALSIFFFAASVNLLGIFILTVVEPEIPLIKLVFEQVSAFGTVGLSTGITDQLSMAGQITIICTMFLGRIGILTFAIALSTPAKASSYRYPKAHIMVG